MDSLPRIVFFNINGSGMGHLSRCLAYARRLRGQARPIFFSLASAIEIIEEMGFEADYFVSEFWSRAHISAWNRELAVRFGLFLEEVRPSAVVFDGTWPFHGFMDACFAAKVPRKVWSNRGLHKPGFAPVPVSEREFDLVLEPGEIGAAYAVVQDETPGRKVRIPPVTIFAGQELLERNDARDALGLERDGRYVLFSLGPGNLKDVGEIAQGLIGVFRASEFRIVWACAPISVRDVDVPDDVLPISVFPLAKYMRAFDGFVGAAGYNACCEVLQSGVPGILLPNKLVADDQQRRAETIAAHARVVVSACESSAEQEQALLDLRRLASMPPPAGQGPDLDGADRATDEILRLLSGSAA